MAKLNVQAAGPRTHEGAVARHITPEQQLRRTVMACMLWEDTFYEDGVSVAERIHALVAKVPAETCAKIAVEARTAQKLRHVPLLIAREMARLDSHKRLVGKLLPVIIQRPDGLAEFLAIYWKEGKCPLSKQVKLGLGEAFRRFSEYSLAKYDRDGQVKLRDVLFLAHAKPRDGKGNTRQERKAGQFDNELYRKIAERTLATPDTWEVALSATQGEGKRETWERLLREKRLASLALIRNLRNFREAGVDESLVEAALDEMKTDRVLPFRFVAAARYAPKLEPALERAMLRCLEGMPKLPGKTVLLVDVSGSMDSPLSDKSEMGRIDAAAGLAILARELCETVAIYTFSDRLVAIPPRRGFALRDAIMNSQQHNGTYLGGAVEKAHAWESNYDRLIVLTDEQSHDRVPDPTGTGYMINVAAYQNGVGYGKWMHVDGWSEAVLSYIAALEGVSIATGEPEAE